jgi:penicillin-binding protein 2
MSDLDEEYRGRGGGSRNRPHGNLNFLRLAVIALFGILAMRLAYMQLVNGADYARRSTENHISQTNILPTRGGIVDRNGQSLVTNVPVYTATILPELLPDSQDARYAIYQKLEQVTGVPTLELQSQVKQAEDSERAYIAINLKTHLTGQQALILDEASTSMPGVSVTITPGRDYIAGASFVHVLGYIGPQTADNRAQYAKQNYDVNEPVGLAGLEAQYESDLRGTAGFTANEQDAQGHLVTALKTKDPVPGNTLKLAIDSGLQNFVADLLTSTMSDSTGNARNAAAVVMSPKTGEVYSIVSIPGYDPAIVADPSAHEAEYTALANDNVHQPLLDHAVSAAAPGSTFKLVTASAALETGHITPQTSIDIPSAVYEVKGANGEIYPLYDWRAQGPGINVYKGIAYSSNIFFYMASCGLYPSPGLGKDVETSADILGTYARDYGFGQPTGIDIGGEADGIIPSPEWKLRSGAADTNWYLADTCFMGIGQGDVKATPIQVARMTAAVANGGKLLTPHVVNQVLSPDGKVVRDIKPQSTTVPVSADHLAEIREGMHQGVQLALGAAHRIQETTSVDVAGKTGTAEFIDTDGVKKQHAWFTGFAPFDDPQVVVTVYYDLGVGGDKAAPVAGKIIDYFMKNVKQ